MTAAGATAGGRTVVIRTVGDERGASARYRILAHRSALEAAGYRTTIRFSNRSGRVARVLDLARDIRASPGADLLLVHRRIYPGFLVRRLRRGARRLVFDMDDALDLPPPSARADAAERRRYRTRFQATVGAFDLVLCGNRELASRLPHDRFALLPTPIDTVRFHPRRVCRSGGAVLGWVGHSDNLPYLEALHGPLRELASRHPGLRIVVVADRPPRLPGLSVEFRPWSLATEVSCFDGIDIGLMPLDDTPWARGKCAFKAIQFLSLGIPAVVSPVGMNREVVRDGDNGFLVDGDAAWVAALDRLVAEPDLARRMGRSGRRLVERRYSLQRTSERLLGLLAPLFDDGLD